MFEWEHITDYLFSQKGIAGATYIGLFLSLLGALFSVLAFIQAKKAKKVAIEAKEAVYNIDAISVLTKVITSMTESQSHMRNKNFAILPDKFISSINSISSVRTGCPVLLDHEKAKLAQICAQIREVKDKIEINLEKENKSCSVAWFNKIVTDQIEHLQEVLEVIKRR